MVTYPPGPQKCTGSTSLFQYISTLNPPREGARGGFHFADEQSVPGAKHSFPLNSEGNLGVIAPHKSLKSFA